MPKSEQGVTADRYTIIPRTLIFLTREKEAEGRQVLLIQGAATKRLWANRYNGIGGHIERGEDALTAARRELLEETGLESADLRLVGTVLIDASETRGIGLYVFHGLYGSGSLVESAEGRLEWVAERRINELPLVEDLYTLLPLILSMPPGAAPFSALYSYDEHERLQVRLGR